MLTRTEGIVLTTRKYGEADLIATYLTVDRGIISAFAKSPRKTKSRFGSSLEPLTHAKLSLWGKEQSLPKITQSDIINSFQGIRDNYRDFVALSKVVEIITSLTPAGLPYRKLYPFFLNVLQTVASSDHEDKNALHLITQIRLLMLIGYAPRLKGCGKCGSESLDFYPDSGTTLCSTCATMPEEKGKPFVRIDHKLIHFYTHSMEWPIHISHRLKPTRQTLSGLGSLLDRHLDYLLSKKLKSSAYIAASQHIRTGS